VRTSHKTPRREVRWKLDKSATNRSLESIVRRFEDYLDCVSASSADSPLRRITASPHKSVSHRCPGYLREEITLTVDVSRSVVVAHQYPSQSEICTICGQLVQNPVPHTTKRRRQPAPPLSSPSSMASRAASNALNRALNLASKKLFGHSSSGHSRASPPKINIPIPSIRSYVPHPFSAESRATWQREFDYMRS